MTEAAPILATINEKIDHYKGQLSQCEVSAKAHQRDAIVAWNKNRTSTSRTHALEALRTEAFSNHYAKLIQKLSDLRGDVDAMCMQFKEVDALTESTERVNRLHEAAGNEMEAPESLSERISTVNELRAGLKDIRSTLNTEIVKLESHGTETDIGHLDLIIQQWESPPRRLEMAETE